jgi:hypothetical protein
MMDYASLLSEKVKGLKPSAIRKFFDILEKWTTPFRSASASPTS